MPEAVARLETLREEVERAIPVDDAELEATAALAAALRRVGRLRSRVDWLPLDELTEVSRRLAATTRSVRDAGEVVGTRLHQI
jgi:hypothetical protein